MASGRFYGDLPYKSILAMKDRNWTQKVGQKRAPFLGLQNGPIVVCIAKNHNLGFKTEVRKEGSKTRFFSRLLCSEAHPRFCCIGNGLHGCALKFRLPLQLYG